MNDCLKIELRASQKHAQIFHFFARHSDVLSILGPNLSDKLDLSHYDKSLKSGSGGAVFFISAEDVTAQWTLLGAALAVSPGFDRDPPQVGASEKCPMSYMQRQAKACVAEALSILTAQGINRTSSSPKFDPVRDYGYLVTFLIVRDVIGLKMPKRNGLYFRLLKLIKRLQGDPIKTLPAREICQSNELVFWIEVMFGHLFINPGGHNKGLRFASQLISNRYRQIIRRSIEAPTPGSLIDRMQTAQLDLKMPQQEFDRLVDNIVMELVGSFQYLTARAFVGVLESIETCFAETLEVDANPLQQFNAQMRQHARPLLDEALRHNSPTALILRTASQDFTHNGMQIARGDMLCVLCDQAAMDPDVFSDPKRFCTVEMAIERQANYIAFASPDTSPSAFTPSENHHPCFGQYWARAILEEMLTGLEQALGQDIAGRGYDS